MFLKVYIVIRACIEIAFNITALNQVITKLLEFL
jgi:hypothetical protein